MAPTDEAINSDPDYNVEQTVSSPQQLDEKHDLESSASTDTARPKRPWRRHPSAMRIAILATVWLVFTA